MVGMPKTRLTDKQYKLMTVICEGNKDIHGKWESPVDLDELLERLAYRTSKESLQFSIRALINKGMITKGHVHRRGANRTVLIPTSIGKHTMGYIDPHFIEEEDFSYLDL